jgi:flagellar protein FliJ
MGQPLESQSQFCITAILHEVPHPNRDRVRRRGIERVHQRVAQMEATVADFDRTANEIEGWIAAEQNRTRIHDPHHFAYSTSAIAMNRRRDALMRSREGLTRTIADLKRQLTDADVRA